MFLSRTLVTLLLIASGNTVPLMTTSPDWSFTATLTTETEVTRTTRVRLDIPNSPAGLDLTIPGSPDDIADMTERYVVSSDGRSHRFYEHPQGGLEWEITLDEPPRTNRLVYSCACRGLVLQYQDSLTIEERALGAHRPDSVIGSWAVYLPARGKVFHVYRPKAWDCTGDTVRCGLAFDTVAQTVSVTIPEQFLRAAAYPVTVDPHFGDDQVGASSINFYDTYNCAHARAENQHTAGSNEVIDSLAMYFVYAGDSAAMAVYEVDSSGLPTGNPIVRTARLGSTTAGQWIIVSVNASLTAGVTYTLAVAECMSGGTRIAYDSYTNSCSRCSGGSFCEPWSEASRRAYLFSAYAVYTTSEPGGAVHIRRRTVLEGSTP